MRASNRIMNSARRRGLPRVAGGHRIADDVPEVVQQRLADGRRRSVANSKPETRVMKAGVHARTRPRRRKLAWSHSDEERRAEESRGRVAVANSMRMPTRLARTRESVVRRAVREAYRRPIT